MIFVQIDALGPWAHSPQHEDVDCAFLVLSGHGFTKASFSHDSYLVTPNGYLNNWEVCLQVFSQNFYLEGKPKVILVQTCRSELLMILFHIGITCIEMY